MAILSAVAALANCGDDGGFPISDNRPRNETCLAREAPSPAGPMRLERVFDDTLPGGGALDQSVQVVQSPRDSDVWYLVRQPGEVIRFSATDDSDAQTALDLSDRIFIETPENGLVSVALHPQEPRAYVVYSAPPSSGPGFLARLAEFTIRGDHTFDPDSETVLLEVPQRVQAHSMNHVDFGPDGYLYVAIGEDIRRAPAQDIDSLYGKILRIDVSASDAERGTEYSIPSDNPFVDGDAPEVFAYGFRNPWRFSFDRETGDLIAGDVGQDTIEELDLVVAGGNYGWPIMEGSTCFETDDCDREQFIEPLLEYTHAEGRSVTAGYRYRGTAIPALQGRYVFADFIFGKVWSSAASNEDGTLRVEAESGFGIPSLYEDRDGELYLVRYSFEGEGGVYELVPNDSEPNDFPQRLSETGCVNPDDPARPAQGVVPYAPTAELWSDGADKERFFAIPDNQRIRVEGDGDFDFPVGTVLVKHFGFDGVLHETRLLMRSDDGWAGYSYEWNDGGTDAVLLESGKARVLDNGVRWQFPSRSECSVCHTEAAGDTLGLEVAQLDHAVDLGGGPENQIAALFERDYFLPSIDDVESLRGDVEPLPDPTGDAGIEARARAYLHANCAMCHRPNGSPRTHIDLRFTTPFAEMNACNEEPEVGAIWDLPAPQEEQRLIRPGAPDFSIIYLRAQLRSAFQMPPVGSGLSDPFGVELIGAWIESTSDCED